MEKIMGKTTHNTANVHDTIEDHGTLVDTELERVTGGMPGLGAILTQALGNATSKAVEAVVSNAGYPRKWEKP
jgi:hypothetical protein